MKFPSRTKLTSIPEHLREASTLLKI